MTTSRLTIQFLFSFFLLCYSSSHAQDPATLPVEMVYVEGGSFTMGCVEGRDDINGLDCQDDEFPTHIITLRDFYIGKYEITQGQYQAIIGENPSFFNSCGLDCPVTGINWYAAIIFCNELTLQDANIDHTERCYYRDASLSEPWEITHYNPANGDPASGNVYFNETRHGYRLPTEAEWEYSARGGLITESNQLAGSSDLTQLASYANFCDSNCLLAHADFNQNDSYMLISPVGTYIQNELGIYDMSGNVWEWCWDDKDDYTFNIVCNPYGTLNSLWFSGSLGHISGTCCPVARGGSWNSPVVSLRVSNRNSFPNGQTQGTLGFRICRYP